jgi:hypothetical protein
MKYRYEFELIYHSMFVGLIETKVKSFNTICSNFTDHLVVPNFRMATFSISENDVTELREFINSNNFISRDEIKISDILIKYSKGDLSFNEESISYSLSRLDENQYKKKSTENHITIEYMNVHFACYATLLNLIGYGSHLHIFQN